MNEKDFQDEDNLDENAGKIPVKDMRRFNDKGERIDGVEEGPKEPVRSTRELELEDNLKAEAERREAAESKLISVQAKFDEAKAGLEKETADMRARLMKTLEDRAKQNQFNFLETLLPVLDNLNRAIGASEKDSSFEHLLEGVKGTARSFEKALESVGVEVVESVGEKFDPELHEAVDMVETDAEQDGHITAVYSHGYKLGDRLLRPARVQVGKAKAQSAGE